MQVITNSVAETIQAGKDFAEVHLGSTEHTAAGTAVLLEGEMGAGKTHFVKGMARGLGIDSVITSPTFALVNEYSGNRGKLYHFDLFRIQSEDDLYAIGFYDYIDNGILAIEWAENIPELEREFDKHYKVKIEKTDENTRKIMIDLIGN